MNESRYRTEAQKVFFCHSATMAGMRQLPIIRGQSPKAAK